MYDHLNEVAYSSGQLFSVKNKHLPPVTHPNKLQNMDYLRLPHMQTRELVA